MEIPKLANNHPQWVYLFENLLLNWSFRFRGPTHCCYMTEERFEDTREQQVILGTQLWAPSQIMIKILSTQLHWNNQRTTMVPSSRQPLLPPNESSLTIIML